MALPELHFHLRERYVFTQGPVVRVVCLLASHKSVQVWQPSL